MSDRLEIVRWGLIVVAIAGCGRLGFDARNLDAGRDGDAAVASKVQLLRPAGAAAGDELGHRVSISRDGTRIAAGAPLHAAEAGAVFVFHRIGDAWEGEAVLAPMVSDAGDQFGWDVELSADGSTLVAGARREDSGATDPANNNASAAGAAYVFTRTGTTWTQHAYLKASNVDAGDSFGERVAISDDGNTVAVTAFSEGSAATGVNGDEADNTAADAGAVYVFTRSGTIWSQQAYVKASNTDAADGFGYSLSLTADGNTLLAGAYREDSAAGAPPTDNSVSSAGAIYVFTRTASWTQTAFLKATHTDPGDNFGYNAVISGNGQRIVVAATGDSSSSPGIDGNELDNSSSSSGAVHIFALTSSWQEQAFIKASNPDIDDEFGFGVAIDTLGDHILVGANSEASTGAGQADNGAMSSGAAYDFVDSSGWNQRAYMKATNPGAGDEYARSVAISGYGGVLVVGAPYEDGDADGAPDHGAVYVYY
jgi:hypothetical protein